MMPFPCNRLHKKKSNKRLRMSLGALQQSFDVSCLAWPPTAFQGKFDDLRAFPTFPVIFAALKKSDENFAALLFISRAGDGCFGPKTFDDGYKNRDGAFAEFTIVCKAGTEKKI
jgi:hypothetical protein